MNTDTIDFVLTWVDGNDPVWLAQKNKYAKTETNMADGDSNASCRFRDYGLLRYWFRAVEAYAPWVNKVFFITCGQKPEWLNESNPKLRLVNHQDYIPSEYLPTFHSNTIELNLHRIPDLSEKFILFNDDFFLLRPHNPNSFFRNGLPMIPCDLGIPNWLGYSNISHIALNNSGLIMLHFNINQLVWKNAMKFFNIFALGPGRAIKNFLSFIINRSLITGTFGHLPSSHLKSTLAEIWRVYPEILDKTSRHKFRYDDCVNQWLLSAWNMISGNFYPVNEKRRGILFALDINNLNHICEVIRNGSTSQVCINDKIPSEHDDDFNTCTIELSKAFNQLLPHKSSFEK
ncbi:MAG: Stealth CR1 domain-containing protein [Victivallales bacterium]|nr:Stealth CR1 domain-containing protein [Victivallales bacterium]